ncbi:hypothetical protein LTR49_026815 [Elasticomyces elasticus]|nr:hypothetical protein LTR49_026815 [Elasticomyces elasticus]
MTTRSVAIDLRSATVPAPARTQIHLTTSASLRGLKRRKVADTSNGDRKIADGLTPNVVVEAIILGARTWAENGDAQMGWAENLERIKPKVEGHDLDPEALVAEYQKYTSTTRWRWWQAMFITCCASVLAAATRKESGRRKMSNNAVSASTALRQRSMAKLLIAVLNRLAREAPEAAFNIIPALSACTSDLVVPQKLFLNPDATFLPSGDNATA